MFAVRTIIRKTSVAPKTVARNYWNGSETNHGTLNVVKSLVAGTGVALFSYAMYTSMTNKSSVQSQPVASAKST